MQMSQRERDTTYQSAVRFCEKNPRAILETWRKSLSKELFFFFFFKLFQKQ